MTHALDALIVGAGPTGLTLAAQLSQLGATFRIVDLALDRVHESRALGVQARSIEILQQLGLGDELVARGNKSVGVKIHVDGRLVASASLGGFAAPDTRYPYILFVSQAETERMLNEHLASRGVVVERGVALRDFSEDALGVTALLRHGDGSEEQVRAKYVVGCDGSHSTVRKRAGIPFEGDAYLQDFMLGDVEADAPPEAQLTTDSIHPCVGAHGIAIFFPLGHPATWRVIAMSSASARASRPEPDAQLPPLSGDLSLGDLQSAIDGATGGTVRVHAPAWLTHFRLHHRQATHYRRGRVLLAGDAAHIHSPVGAQGMNTGIQDAWNLGWKLALVARGHAEDRLLDTYEQERWPVGRTLLRYTDRAFSVLVRSLSASRVASWLRRNIPARLIPLVLRSRSLRTLGFRFISELDINYRSSPAVREGTPRLRAGPHAGDRLPDAPVHSATHETFLHDAIAGARFCVLLCGSEKGWNTDNIQRTVRRHKALITIRYLTRDQGRDLVDVEGDAFRRLGVRDSAHFLVRPDGYIAYRCAGSDLTGLAQYLREWLPLAP